MESEQGVFAMKRSLKVLLGIVLGITGFAALALLAVVLLLDPNDYRDDIEQAVLDATGRELQIEDPLSLSIFPWLGVETGRIRLGNASGFDGDFLSLSTADVHLRLMPLILRQAVEVDEIRVEGLRLNLAVNAAGESNWADLADDGDSAPDEGTTDQAFDPADLKAITIGGLSISGASLNWADEQAGMTASIRDWSLESGRIRWGDPVDLLTRFDFSLSEPAMSGHFEGEGSLLAEMGETNRIRFGEALFTVGLEGDGAPLSSLELGWQALVLDMDDDRLAIQDLDGRLDDMPFTGRVAVERLSTAPAVAFGLSFDELDLDRLGAGKDAESAPEGEPLDLDAVEIPADAIRGQDLDGQLNIGKLTIAGMSLEEVEARVRIVDDRLRLDPVNARLYGGSQNAVLEIDASESVPRVRIEERLEGVAIDGLFADLFAVDRLSGRADIDMQLEGRGRTVGELRPTLNGNMRMLFEEGALEGVDVMHELSRASARLRDDGRVLDDRGRTPFTAMGVRGRVRDGRLISEEAGMRLDKVAISGSGWLSLVDMEMEYRLMARVLEGAPRELRADRVDVRGRGIPFRVTGTPFSPRLRFDIETLLQDAGGDEARDRLREERDEAEQNLRDRLRR